MEVLQPTIGALTTIITGNSASDGTEYSPYRTGPELVEFFNQFGFNDEYGQGFPSRHIYAKSKLKELQRETGLKGAIEAAVDPRHFIEFEGELEDAVDYLNDYLKHDGYQLVEIGERFRVRDRAPIGVEGRELSFADRGERQQFIDEHLEKCDRKLAQEDFSGAITNARSVVEEALLELEALLDPSPPDYDGKLSPLYKRVYQKLNLDPSQEGMHNSAREVLSGLISVISGLAPMRNKMSDAHALEYPPRRHHAELAVNSAKTVLSFLSGTVEHQVERGFVDLEVDE